jgi:hypothetical protein
LAVPPLSATHRQNSSSALKRDSKLYLGNFKTLIIIILRVSITLTNVTLEFEVKGSVDG